VLPARQGIELQDFAGCVLEEAEGLATAASGVLLRAIEPETFEDLAFDQCADGVDSRPIAGPFDEVLLGAMRKAISKSLQPVRRPTSRASFEVKWPMKRANC
jgi:hypothetical protein